MQEGDPCGYTNLECGHYKEEEIPCEAVYEWMAATDQHGLSSIAFPALGLGNRRFPLDTCTHTFVAAVTHFLDDHPGMSMKLVGLVDPADRVVKSFLKCPGVVLSERDTPARDHNSVDVLTSKTLL